MQQMMMLLHLEMDLRQQTLTSYQAARQSGPPLHHLDEVVALNEQLNEVGTILSSLLHTPLRTAAEGGGGGRAEAEEAGARLLRRSRVSVTPAPPRSPLPPQPSVFRLDDAPPHGHVTGGNVADDGDDDDVEAGSESDGSSVTSVGSVLRRDILGQGNVRRNERRSETEQSTGVQGSGVGVGRAGGMDRVGTRDSVETPRTTTSQMPATPSASAGPDSTPGRGSSSGLIPGQGQSGGQTASTETVTDLALSQRNSGNYVSTSSTVTLPRLTSARNSTSTLTSTPHPITSTSAASTAARPSGSSAYQRTLNSFPSSQPRQRQTNQAAGETGVTSDATARPTTSGSRRPPDHSPDDHTQGRMMTSSMSSRLSLPNSIVRQSTTASPRVTQGQRSTNNNSRIKHPQTQSRSTVTSRSTAATSRSTAQASTGGQQTTSESRTARRQSTSNQSQTTSTPRNYDTRPRGAVRQSNDVSRRNSQVTDTSPARGSTNSVPRRGSYQAQRMTSQPVANQGGGLVRARRRSEIQRQLLMRPREGEDG